MSYTVGLDGRTGNLGAITPAGRAGLPAGGAASPGSRRSATHRSRRPNALTADWMLVTRAPRLLSASMAKTVAELTAIAHRHAAAEADGDLAATLATLEAEPVYELYPVGLRMTGLPLARRYYEHFFASVAPRIAGYEMLGEWINEQGVLQEYRVAVRYDDGRVRDFRIMGLLKFGDTALDGRAAVCRHGAPAHPLRAGLGASSRRPETDGRFPSRLMLFA